jgi:hypothetical protein
MSDQRSITASVAYWGSIAALTTGICGLLGIQFRLLQPITGFYLFALGTLVGGIFALSVGLAALWVTRHHASGIGRKRAWIASAIGFALSMLLVTSALPGREFPPINDITTDLADPPAFASASLIPAYAGFDMGYPAEFVSVVQEGYPDLASLELNLTPSAAYTRSVETAKDLGWDVTHQDPAKGRFDASDTTRIFRFVDDITVRIRPQGSGSEVDIRSRSRVGRGDLGANAQRIGVFYEGLKSR